MRKFSTFPAPLCSSNLSRGICWILNKLNCIEGLISFKSIWELDVTSVFPIYVSIVCICFHYLFFRSLDTAINKYVFLFTYITIVGKHVFKTSKKRWIFDVQSGYVLRIGFLFFCLNGIPESKNRLQRNLVMFFTFDSLIWKILIQFSIKLIRNRYIGIQTNTKLYKHFSS